MSSTRKKLLLGELWQRLTPQNLHSEKNSKKNFSDTKIVSNLGVD